jgi:hypothetical protein
LKGIKGKKRRRKKGNKFPLSFAEQFALFPTETCPALSTFHLLLGSSLLETLLLETLNAPSLLLPPRRAMGWDGYSLRKNCSTHKVKEGLKVLRITREAQPVTLTEEEEGVLHRFLEYQRDELEIMLPQISVESLRILEERARELQMNWLVPGENEEIPARPRAGTPYPRDDTPPSPPPLTYQDRGVSPFFITEKEGESVCLDYKDLNNKLREYERELQIVLPKLGWPRADFESDGLCQGRPD